MAEAGAAAPRPRRFWRASRIFVLLVALLAADWLQEPRRQLSTGALLLLIDAYQATLSPRMPALGVHCRFEPTCSHYGEEVLRCHGLPRGAILAAWRILRCGPYTPLGTLDEPPCAEAEKDPLLPVPKDR